MNELEFPELRQAIEEKREFRFSGKLNLRNHVIFIMIIVIFMLYLIINTIIAIGDSEFLGPLLTLTNLGISYFVVISITIVLIWYYWNIYQRRLIINSKEIQFLFRNKIKERIKWDNVSNISKLKRRFFSSEKVNEEKKWNILIIKTISGEEFMINPNKLKDGENLNESLKEKIYFIISSYQNG
ncbi:MAG: hypothetical protein BAJALOKI2v1_230050 [Promethearchaeota archaeon]|nr:MAG: hypothetical protein BAJALOKI2v1_230050 [Candidatus Lokiarchaeota archaeon]